MSDPEVHNISSASLQGRYQSNVYMARAALACACPQITDPRLFQ
jgi:hypothetical protein